MDGNDDVTLIKFLFQVSLFIWLHFLTFVFLSSTGDYEEEGEEGEYEGEDGEEGDYCEQDDEEEEQDGEGEMEESDPHAKAWKVAFLCRKVAFWSTVC